MRQAIFILFVLQACTTMALEFSHVQYGSHHDVYTLKEKGCFDRVEIVRNEMDGLTDSLSFYIGCQRQDFYSGLNRIVEKFEIGKSISKRLTATLSVAAANIQPKYWKAFFEAYEDRYIARKQVGGNLDPKEIIFDLMENYGWLNSFQGVVRKLGCESISHPKIGLEGKATMDSREYLESLGIVRENYPIDKALHGFKVSWDLVCNQ